MFGMKVLWITVASCLNNAGGSWCLMLVYGGSDSLVRNGDRPRWTRDSSPIISLNKVKTIFYCKLTHLSRLPLRLYEVQWVVSQTSSHLCVFYLFFSLHVFGFVKLLWMWLESWNVLGDNSPQLFFFFSPSLIWALQLSSLSSFLMALSNRKHMMLSLNPHPNVPHWDDGEGGEGEMHICGAALIIRKYWEQGERGRRREWALERRGPQILFQVPAPVVVLLV